MPAMLNETHDPALTSWVESAGRASGFPVQNLPYACFRPAGGAPRIGVAIGDAILDLSGAPVEGLPAELRASTLNDFMALGPRAWSEARLALSRALRAGARATDGLRPHLVPQRAVEYALPAAIGDYTDFYASIHHATNVGSMFRPDNPLLPNYKHVPIGYHGRASFVIVVSGTAFIGRWGRLQRRRNEAADLRSIAAAGLRDGDGRVHRRRATCWAQRIPIEDAARHIFGL